VEREVENVEMRVMKLLAFENRKRGEEGTLFVSVSEVVSM
jgi:hypothetical protein